MRENLYTATFTRLKPLNGYRAQVHLLLIYYWLADKQMISEQKSMGSHLSCDYYNKLVSQVSVVLFAYNPCLVIILLFNIISKAFKGRRPINLFTLANSLVVLTTFANVAFDAETFWQAT